MSEYNSDDKKVNRSIKTEIKTKQKRNEKKKYGLLKRWIEIVFLKLNVNSNLDC